jgi:repressor LexA
MESLLMIIGDYFFLNGIKVEFSRFVRYNLEVHYFINLGGNMALTKRQFEVLAFLDRFIAAKGYCPSFVEIAQSLKLSSIATVHKHIHTLQKKGFLCLGENQSRSIEILDRTPLLRLEGIESGTSKPGAFTLPEIPLLGFIAAGRPLEAIQNSETLSLKDFVGKPEVYLLKVTGDSMVEDHICDGDYVVVERTNTAENGDTVVALLHQSDATLKRFYREKDHQVRLQPANAVLKPIFVEESQLQIQGRVIAVLRKY